MKRSLNVRKVYFKKRLQFCEREVCRTVRIRDGHGLPDFTVLKTSELALRFLPQRVEFLNLKIESMVKIKDSFLHLKPFAQKLDDIANA